MENSGFLSAVTVYLAILALAVGWFLVPRWIYGSKALKIEKSRLERNVVREDPDVSARGLRRPPDWRQPRLFPGSSRR